MKADPSLTPPFDRIPVNEPSRFVGFAGNIIESRSEERSDDDLERALQEAGTRLMLVQGGKLIVAAVGGSREARHDLATARGLGADLDQAVLLGRDGDAAVVMAPCGLADEALPEPFRAIGFRALYTEHLVSAEVLGALAQGASLLAWHASHQYCGRCGGPTAMRAAGYRRHCTSCGASLFPRTDPVVIMLTIAGDSCLLGRGPHFAPGVYSCLAGFLEPGETMEAAVRRETFEEAGIRIGRVAYHASQPWPFPHTLMIGCFAEALTTELHVDTRELEDCRWFARGEVRAALAGERDDLRFPAAGAIATHLIRAWALG